MSGEATIEKTVKRGTSDVLSTAISAGEKNGVVYTKRWVVDLILDLVGYRPDERLFEQVIVEPAAGDGSFLRAVATRLADSCRKHGKSLSECRAAVVAFELDEPSTHRAQNMLQQFLPQYGLTAQEARNLACAWVKTGDYLLEWEPLREGADYVVGNPPYIRLENLPDGGQTYRSLFKSMVGRADIYVGFFEAALRQLKPNGYCGFICADRWMFNQYGAELRQLITTGFSVEAVIQMHLADAFEREVSAYPAITVIRNGAQRGVTVATLEADMASADPAHLSAEFTGQSCAAKLQTNPAQLTNATRLHQWFSGKEPWPLVSAEHLALLRRLELGFPTLEETGSTVGIGVATGADRIFITQERHLIETDRLLPLAMARDIKGSTVEWSGHYLINPWNGAGLVDLQHFPKLAAYFESHGERLRARHTARKKPESWYRTIDRLSEPLTRMNKLYLPDFKERLAPVLDIGKTYPHHNLYYIVPAVWDAEVLGGLLLSDVAQFFIECYGVKMRGGYFRFQAQYLRRIRVPWPGDITRSQTERLRKAFAARDVPLANRVAADLYGLTQKEKRLCEY